MDFIDIVEVNSIKLVDFNAPKQLLMLSFPNIFTC